MNLNLKMLYALYIEGLCCNAVNEILPLFDKDTILLFVTWYFVCVCERERESE